MKCNNCGADLDDNAKFCTSCGASLEANTSQVEPVDQGAKELENKLANSFDRNKKATGKNIGMIIGGLLVALVLVYFVIKPLFIDKLSDKKAAEIVKGVFEDAMEYDFDDVRKYFAQSAQDEADYFISPFQDFKTYYGDYTDKTLHDFFIDVEVETINFLYNKDTKTAKGNFNVFSAVKKRYFNDPMVSNFKGAHIDEVEVEFMKEGRKWVITSID